MANDILNVFKSLGRRHWCGASFEVIFILWIMCIRSWQLDDCWAHTFTLAHMNGKICAPVPCRELVFLASDFVFVQCLRDASACCARVVENIVQQICLPATKPLPPNARTPVTKKCIFVSKPLRCFRLLARIVTERLHIHTVCICLRKSRRWARTIRASVFIRARLCASLACHIKVRTQRTTHASAETHTCYNIRCIYKFSWKILASMSTQNDQGNWNQRHWGGFFVDIEFHIVRIVIM